MLSRLGRFTVRRRRWVIVSTLLGVVVAGVVGGGVFERLSGGGFADPDAESTVGEERLERVFRTGDPNLVLLVTARDGSVDDPAVAAEGIALTEELLAERGIRQAFSYWTLGSPPPLRSDDASQALVLARIAGDEDEVDAVIEQLAPEYTRSDGDMTVDVGGSAQVFRQISTQGQSDLQRAEIITFPVVLILLVLVFGGVIAAGLPLAIGGIAVVGTFLVLSLLTIVTDVSIFSINLTTALGIGLGIDYSLFIVSRFREEMRAGLASDDAVVRTVETAGRTILFSGLTVAISLAALLVFPMYFLRSFAYAGIAVVAVAIVGLLLLLGTPFLGARFGLPDDRVLPESASSRQVQDQIRANFTSREASALSIVAVEAGPAGATRDAEVDRYAAELSAIDGAARVDASTGSYQDG